MSAGLTILRARREGAEIAADMSPQDLAAAVASGSIAILKGAFDPAELLRIRAEVLAWDPVPGEPDTSPGAPSARYRGDEPPGTHIRHVFESYYFAVDNPGDAMGSALRAPFALLASFWRRLTGGVHDFSPGPDGKSIRPWIHHYPSGGGHFDWHEHPLEPTKIGMIVSMSRIGVDLDTGGTEFKTPFGIVDTMSHHDIGDVCLFRYDLSHRVTKVDPDRERDWDGRGRWTMLLLVR